ncbi:MAG: hypothetical protein WCP07_05050 [bacterium]
MFIPSRFARTFAPAVVVRPFLMSVAGIAAVCSTLSAAQAQTVAFGNYYYTSASTINTDISGSNVVIGKTPVSGTPATDTNIATSYTVDIATGAIISGFSGNYRNGVSTYSTGQLTVTDGSISGLSAFDTSLMTINGGGITGFLAGFDNAGITIAGGTHTADVKANNNSNVTLSGGAVTGDINAFDDAIVTLNGGTLNGDVASDNASALNISAGSVSGSVSGFGSSIVTITGGAISNGVYAYDSAQANVTGGTITGGITADSGSKVTVDGASVTGDATATGNGKVTLKSGTITGNASASNSGVVTITGGALTGNVTGSGSGQVYITGGTFGSPLLALNDAVFSFQGSNLTLSAPVRTDTDALGAFTVYNVSGNLLDNSLFSIEFYDYQDGGFDVGGPVGSVPIQFNAVPGPPSDVPEPGAIAFGFLASATIVGLVVRKRQMDSE